MRLHAFLASCCWISAACAPGPIGGSEAAEATNDSSSSTTETSSSSSTSSGPSETSSDDESSTDTDEEPDTCPVDPELGQYDVLLDGNGWAIDFPTLDGSSAWTQACTVSSHSGALASGETIVLECIDEQGQAVEHTIELLAELDGAPLEVPVLVGQQVELALWVRVWFSGTVAWTLRDAEHNLLLLHYNGPYWPEPAAIEDEFAPPLEHIAPLTVGVNTDVCPLVCLEDDPTAGGFIPTDNCCSKDTALRLDLGDGPAQIQQNSGGTIPGPAGAHAIVETSIYVDTSTCNVSDINSEYYVFTIISGS